MEAPQRDDNELKNTGYEIFIGDPVGPVDREPRPAVRHRGRQPRHGAVGDERAPQRHLPGRLHLPAVHGRVEVQLLLPPVRLGRPARQPAVRTGEDPARLPPRAGLPPPARRTASRTSSAACSRTGPAVRCSPCCSWASWCSSSAASRSSTSSSTRPAPTSPRPPTPSGTSSSPSRPSATATGTP